MIHHTFISVAGDENWSVGMKTVYCMVIGLALIEHREFKQHYATADIGIQSYKFDAL